jgi:hypothetical protein
VTTNISPLDWWSVAHVASGLLIGWICWRWHYTYKQMAIILIFACCGWELFEQTLMLDVARSGVFDDTIIQWFYADAESLVNSVTDVLITFLAGILSVGIIRSMAGFMIVYDVMNKPRRKKSRRNH